MEEEIKDKGFKIPILWRMERFFLRRKQEKLDNDGKRPNKLLSRHKRTYSRECPECGNMKWIKRKNSEKCTKCGHKVYIGKELVEHEIF